MDIKAINSLILSKASKVAYTVADIAPSTFNDLKANGLVIWSRASDHTIYEDARVNHAFRAIHDAMHLSLGAEFTLDGEIWVAKEQARQAGSDLLAELILAEVIGQAEYFKQHGVFPSDQKAFTQAYLKNKGVL